MTAEHDRLRYRPPDPMTLLVDTMRTNAKAKRKTSMKKRSTNQRRVSTNLVLLWKREICARRGKTLDSNFSFSKR